MNIQELLKQAFEAGIQRGRKPFSHVDCNAIDFEEWLEENQTLMYQCIHEFNERQKREILLDSPD